MASNCDVCLPVFGSCIGLLLVYFYTGMHNDGLFVCYHLYLTTYIVVVFLMKKKLNKNSLRRVCA